ncbi:VanZ family protein [Virgibacillus necropolis]|uniref:VanZ family protein n=1 Tax=Virgibacillus necropolis TaxID=163877 RepID=A0A221MAP6_9BACI|nr:VanZ family protein [Virgibacillus necropolis]ASN04711.1 VanZ family protein [Virgibacillus necropolis]
MKKMKYWLLPVGWMGVIFNSSATPYQEQDIKPLLSDSLDLSFLVPVVQHISFYYHHSEVSVAALGIEGFIEFFIRKGAHISVYFILMCLFYLAFKKTIRASMKTRLLLSFIFTSLYAALDEFHQGFTQNRTPYVGDVGLDMFGALLAFILIVVSFKVRKRRV